MQVVWMGALRCTIQTYREWHIQCEGGSDSGARPEWGEGDNDFGGDAIGVMISQYYILNEIFGRHFHHANNVGQDEDAEVRGHFHSKVLKLDQKSGCFCSWEYDREKQHEGEVDAPELLGTTGLYIPNRMLIMPGEVSFRNRLLTMPVWNICWSKYMCMYWVPYLVLKLLHSWVLHAKMDTYFMNLRVWVIQVFLKWTDTMYVGKHFSLANFFALLAHVHQHIVYLAFQDIYFIKMSA